MDAQKYTYLVFWSEDDHQFVGICEEFPDLSWLSPSQTEALSGIVDMVKDILSDMKSKGKEIPVPLSL